MHNCEKQQMISHPPRQKNAADEELIFFQNLSRPLSIAAKPTSTLAAAYVHLNPCHKITTNAQRTDKETTKATKKPSRKQKRDPILLSSEQKQLLSAILVKKIGDVAENSRHKVERSRLPNRCKQEP
jgi:hypothetical protein